MFNEEYKAQTLLRELPRPELAGEGLSPLPSYGEHADRTMGVGLYFRRDVVGGGGGPHPHYCRARITASCTMWVVTLSRRFISLV